MTVCVNCAKFRGCNLSSPNVNECADYKEILTNEEWFCKLSTEEKAEWLSKIKQPFPCSTFLKCDKSCGLSTQCRGDDVEPTDKERWVEWLKQPHTFE